ncbi:hypothetical protein EDB85DRAFT_1898947 [Lactarius pseudohatsudake]|nr:hypothetical protein EDB85DRAFT_1898947 [Lactarius pseudohatsudake]
MRGDDAPMTRLGWVEDEHVSEKGRDLGSTMRELAPTPGSMCDVGAHIREWAGGGLSNACNTTREETTERAAGHAGRVRDEGHQHLALSFWRFVGTLGSDTEASARTWVAISNSAVTGRMGPSLKVRLSVSTASVWKLRRGQWSDKNRVVAWENGTAVAVNVGKKRKAQCKQVRGLKRVSLAHAVKARRGITCALVSTLNMHGRSCW